MMREEIKLNEGVRGRVREMEGERMAGGKRRVERDEERD